MDRHGAHRSGASPPGFRAPVDGACASKRWRRRQVDWIKLDATEMGAPLYRQLGFEPECGDRALGSDGADRRAAYRDLSWRERRSRTRPPGIRRRPFRAARHAGAAGGGWRIAGEGYAMARPGSQAAYFGPCVSRRAEAAAELLAWFLARHPGEPVCWDLLPHNTEAVRLARAFGFDAARRLGAHGAARSCPARRRWPRRFASIRHRGL